MHCLAAVCLRHNGQSICGPVGRDAAAQPGVARHGADTQPQSTNATGNSSGSKGIRDVQESGLGDDQVIADITDAATRHGNGLLGGSEALGEAEVDEFEGHRVSNLLIGPHGQGRQQARGDLPGGHRARG